MSSKRKLRRKECGEKIKHVTLASAQIHVRFLRTKGEDVRAYGCRICGGWHVGHKPSKVKSYKPGANKPQTKGFTHE
jgi:hypothetical protein